MVIGALGVLDDVTVTQAAAVWELSAANPSASRRRADRCGAAHRPYARRLGGEHPGPRVRRCGDADSDRLRDPGLPGQYVVSTEIVAMEVVRGLVGSLGIIAAVPLTTALAAMAVADRSRDLVAPNRNTFRQQLKNQLFHHASSGS